MVLASEGWFSTRADLLCSIFVGVGATVCILISLDAGNLKV